MPDTFRPFVVLLVLPRQFLVLLIVRFAGREVVRRVDGEGARIATAEDPELLEL